MTNTSGKVTVSREVAEAIELISQNTAITIEEAVRIHGERKSHGYTNPKLAAINDLPLDTLIRALYIGYEVEKSPEDRLAEELAHSEKFRDTSDWHGGRAHGIKTAAEILGVKLPEPTEGADAN